MPTHPALPLMREAAKGVLLRFATDLTTHDAAALRARPAELPFLWVLRESGTHLCWPNPKFRGPANDLRALLKTLARDFGDVRGWYVWNGRELRALTSAEEALRLLDNCNPRFGGLGPHRYEDDGACVYCGHREAAP